MSAGQLKLTIEQGATWRRRITWEAGGVPVDLAGYTARMQIRKTHAAPTALLDLAVGSGIIITSALGRIDVEITDGQTAALPAGTWQYDLELYAPEGDVTRLLEGKCVVTPEVTR